MKRIVGVVAIVVAFAGGAVGASWWTERRQVGTSGQSAPIVYACPMHPEIRRDHAGECPICGMDLEQVLPDASGTMGMAGSAGAIYVSAERQQAIGVRVGVVSRVNGTRLLRTTGRVTPDENRTYPLVAAVSGWIRNVENVATGDAVRQDQVLASFVVPDAEFKNAQQSYYTTLEAFYRMAATQAPPSLSLSSHESTSAAASIERMADELRSMGVPNSQLREMGKARQVVQDIRVQSPVDGIVLKRNVTPGLRFDRGFELYQIADLSRVWIAADVYRRDLPFIRRGVPARVMTADRDGSLTAIVSASEPIFDEATLTSKVRLETTNPNLALKPGMFVDVEFALDRPPALVVPADAIVDTGLRQTVFVDWGDGHFEPRQIETGWRAGDEVEVTRGLAPGERIVISGTFFIDSESRMKAAR